MDQLAALASWNEALGMDLRETHREVNRIRCKVEVDEVTIGRVRGALWQGKEVGSEEDMSILMVEMRRSPLSTELSTVIPLIVPVL